jgi:hypothetical protein
MKSIMNLTTSIHDMKFNHDTQILGISSHSKRDQLKMVNKSKSLLKKKFIYYLINLLIFFY